MRRIFQRGSCSTVVRPARPCRWSGHTPNMSKLVRSLKDGRVFDLPPQTVQRYQVQGLVSPYFSWRFSQKCSAIPAGKLLRMETVTPARIHWSVDAWTTVHDSATRDSGVGLYLADLPTAQLSVGTEIIFTFYWPEVDRWEGNNFVVQVR